MERLTRKRKGRMTTIFFANWPKGSLARRAMLTRARVRKAKEEKGGGLRTDADQNQREEDNDLCPGVRWWIGLSTPLW
jgi:hypothetical protein